MIRQMAGSEVLDRGDYIVVRTPSNPTFWWGNYILVGADFADAQRWLQTFAVEHPDADHVAIGLDADAPADSLLEPYIAAGLEPDVSTVLVAAGLSAPVAAQGVVCRALDGDDDWHQALDLMIVINDTADLEFVNRKLIEWRELTEAGHGAWFGAFVDGRVRSSLGVLTDGDGLARYQSVETHADFRRRGLARALIATAGQTMVSAFGADSLVIVADPDYHATTLYRSLGFVDRDTQIQVAKRR